MTPSLTYHCYWRKPHAVACMALLALTLSFVATTASTAEAEEPWRPFLDSLRTSGYHDMALLYLDRMAARTDCPPTLREILDYERGITRLSQPAASRREQVEKLAKASDLFTRFQEQHPDHLYTTKAQTQLANVLIERGRMLTDDSKQLGVSSIKQKSLFAEARQFYAKARKVFAKQDTRLTAELKGLSEPKTPVETEQRNALRADFLQTRLSLATTDYEIGMTYPVGDSERESLLREAAKRYGDLYEKYGSFLAGLYARLWEGRCEQKLGNFAKAIKIFKKIILEADNSQAFRTLKNKATILLLETLIDPEVKQYSKAIHFYDDWEKNRPPSEISTPEGIELRYLVALAALEKARSVGSKHKDYTKHIIGARSAFRFVMRFPGEMRTKARQKMTDPLLATGEAKKIEPKDFPEAVELGRVALDKIEIAQIREQIGKEKLTPRELQAIETEAEQEALDYFKQAIEMAKPDTPVVEVNQVRYYLAYLYFKQRDFYRAAVYADYLARRFPNSPVGPPAAKIAMASFIAMSSTQGLSPEEKAFAQHHTNQAATYITEVWPTSAEANGARKILIHLALNQNDIPQALAMVENFPPQAEGRGSLEMLVGRALYAEYVRQMAILENETSAATPDGQPSPEIDLAKTEELLNQAKSLIISGLDQSIAEGKIDRSFFMGELILARIYLDAGEDDDAIELVERAETGLLPIANAADPTMITGGLDIEAYKTSLRVLVAMRELSKASRVMELIEQRVAETDQKGGGTQLMQIYISLAQELQQTLEMLRKSGKVKGASQVRDSFEQFLDRVSSSSESASFSVMQWLAATYSGLAESFDKKENGALTSEAKGYCEKAVKIYSQILKRYDEDKKRYDEDKKFAPSTDAIDLVEVRLATCQRQLGKYREAIVPLLRILRSRNTMVDAQFEAAYTFQAWAGTKGNAKRYLNAMLGSGKDKKNPKVKVIWGWGKLSKKLARDKRYRHLFHEARYNLALCRYKYAVSGVCKDPKKNLKAAQQDIKIISKLYPKMGGDEIRAKYKRLYDRITKTLKK